MPFRRPQAHDYDTLGGDAVVDKDTIAWYWRLTALASSWMILGGYLILPAVYDKDPQLRFGVGVLNIIIVTLLTAGYSFTALLCYACRNPLFQTESVFLPALASSALGLLTVLYNFAHSKRYVFNTAAIIAVTLSASSTVVYSLLLVLAHRRVVRVREAFSAGFRSGKLYQDTAYYQNYLSNMYPSARSNEPLPPSEDELVSQQMAALLRKHDSRPSPEASQSTFRIDLPDDPDHEVPGTEVVQRPRQSAPPRIIRDPHDAFAQSRGNSLPDRNWERPPVSARSRTESLWSESSMDNRGRHLREPPRRERALSREERRAEIELGYDNRRSQ